MNRPTPSPSKEVSRAGCARNRVLLRGGARGGVRVANRSVIRTAAFLLMVVALLDSSPLHGGELTAVELKDARKLYVGKCAKCHKLYDPDGYTPEKWDEWMVKMNRKAKLKPEQAELLARYIAAGKAGQVQLPK